MTLPRVSIVTPSYQQGAYLEETILSVFDQNYPNLEYWIIDGGSKDGSVEIIKKYADRLAGWVSERDSGQAEAINKGFARATGEYVAWINSDDYYLPGAIEAAVSVLEQNPQVGLVYGDVVAINGVGERINVQTFRQMGLDELMQFKIIGQPSVFMRRSVLEKSGYLDMSYHYLLDHELWLRVAQYGEIRYEPQLWSVARYHPAAKNVAHTTQYGIDAFRLVEWMKNDAVLGPRYQRLEKKVLAGAHRIDAHYLLDGGRYRESLRAYLRSLALYPPAVLPDYRRILYAAASLLFNLEAIKQGYLERRKKRLSQGK